MKIKTSITLSEEVLREVDRLSGRYGNRSVLIEQAIREFLAAGERRSRDLKDMEILNRRAAALNREAEDVLSYDANGNPETMTDALGVTRYTYDELNAQY